MASKRFDGQTFFPVRGKKQLPGDSGPVGFHSARGRRSLTDLSRLFYYDNDYPILQRLYPEIAKLPPVYRGGHKRLDSFSFYGVRGKRPSEWDNRFRVGKPDSGDRIKSYLPRPKISGRYPPKRAGLSDSQFHNPFDDWSPKMTFLPWYL